jgi:hypothetical protein
MENIKKNNNTYFYLFMGLSSFFFSVFTTTIYSLYNYAIPVILSLIFLVLSLTLKKKNKNIDIPYAKIKVFFLFVFLSNTTALVYFFFFENSPDIVSKFSFFFENSPDIKVFLLQFIFNIFLFFLILFCNNKYKILSVNVVVPPVFFCLLFTSISFCSFFFYEIPKIEDNEIITILNISNEENYLKPVSNCSTIKECLKISNFEKKEELHISSLSFLKSKLKELNFKKNEIKKELYLEKKIALKKEVDFFKELNPLLTEEINALILSGKDTGNYILNTAYKSGTIIASFRSKQIHLEVKIEGFINNIEIILNHIKLKEKILNVQLIEFKLKEDGKIKKLRYSTNIQYYIYISKNYYEKNLKKKMFFMNAFFIASLFLFMIKQPKTFLLQIFIVSSMFLSINNSSIIVQNIDVFNLFSFYALFFITPLLTITYYLYKKETTTKPTEVINNKTELFYYLFFAFPFLIIYSSFLIDNITIYSLYFESEAYLLIFTVPMVFIILISLSNYLSHLTLNFENVFFPKLFLKFNSVFSVIISILYVKNLLLKNRKAVYIFSILIIKIKNLNHEEQKFILKYTKYLLEIFLKNNENYDSQDEIIIFYYKIITTLSIKTNSNICFYKFNHSLIKFNKKNLDNIIELLTNNSIEEEEKKEQLKYLIKFFSEDNKKVKKLFNILSEINFISIENYEDYFYPIFHEEIYSKFIENEEFLKEYINDLKIKISNEEEDYFKDFFKYYNVEFHNKIHKLFPKK